MKPHGFRSMTVTLLLLGLSLAIVAAAATRIQEQPRAPVPKLPSYGAKLATIDR